MTSTTTQRVWGSYTVLEESATHKVKRIEVNVGHQISLQYHQKRSEHWIVVQGTGNVINGEREFILSANQSSYIPVGAVHRVTNIGDDVFVFIEVQCGTYLGEDDIVRLEDRYGRI